MLHVACVRLLQQLQGLQRPDSTPRTSKAGHSHTESIPPAFSSSKKFGFSGYLHAVVKRMRRVQLGDLVPELWNRWDYDLIAKRCYEKHGIDIYEPKASPRWGQCAGSDLAKRGLICHSDATVVGKYYKIMCLTRKIMCFIVEESRSPCSGIRVSYIIIKLHCPLAHHM